MQGFDVVTAHITNLIGDITTLVTSQISSYDTLHQYCLQLHTLKCKLTERVLTLPDNANVNTQNSKFSLYMMIESAYLNANFQLYSHISDEAQNRWLCDNIDPMAQITNLLTNGDNLRNACASSVCIFRDVIKTFQLQTSDLQNKERLESLHQIFEVLLFVKRNPPPPGGVNFPLQEEVKQFITYLNTLNLEQQSPIILDSFSNVIFFLKASRYITPSEDYLDFLMAYMKMTKVIVRDPNNASRTNLGRISEDLDELKGLGIQCQQNQLEPLLQSMDALRVSYGLELTAPVPGLDNGTTMANLIDKIKDLSPTSAVINTD
jgi:hypothetical protein